MKRKVFTVLAVVIAVIMMLPACATVSPTTAPQQSAASVASVAPAATAAAEDGPFTPYAKTVTISIGMGVDPTEKLPEGDTPDNNQYTRYIKDKLNIQVTAAWQASNGKDLDQKIDLSIAANDLPDGLFIGNDTQFHAAVQANELADMNASYNTYASPAMKKIFDSTGGLAMKYVTSGGKMLGVPNIPVPDDGYTIVWVRKDWLDKLGLQPPSTIADLQNIAQQFITKDPGNVGKDKVIGIAGPQNGGKLYDSFLQSTNVTFGFDPIFSACDAYPGFWVKDANGNPIYGSITPETKTALGKLADMYKQGLIDPQMGVRKDATEPVVSGTAGIFCSVWWMGYWPLPDALKNNPSANWQSYMLKDDKGVINNHMGAVCTQYSVIRKDYKNPEALIKMLNLLIRDESTFDVTKAQIGDYPLRVAMASSDETPVTRQALMDVLNGKTQIADYNDAKYDVYKLLRGDVKNVATVKKAPFENFDIQNWNVSDANFPRDYSILVGTNAFYTQTVNKVYSLTYSQTASMPAKWPTLQKMEDETFLKIIMGAAPLSDFDTFVANWKAQGGDDITKEVADSLK
jgi:putative aldouronate transport system substrate-binding protein